MNPDEQMAKWRAGMRGYKDYANLMTMKPMTIRNAVPSEVRKMLGQQDIPKVTISDPWINRRQIVVID